MSKTQQRIEFAVIIAIVCALATHYDLSLSMTFLLGGCMGGALGVRHAIAAPEDVR